MSGHSKWSTIKRKKGANDAKRGAAFTRLARDIAIAARNGGDPESNFALRLAIDKARASNMPKDNIERAIRRGTGEDKDGAQFEELRLEAYGPSGIALIVEAATDNRNRTLAEVKHALNKLGGSMAEPNAVIWQFSQKGFISAEKNELDFDELFMLAAEAGADDVEETEDGIVEIYSPLSAHQSVQIALLENGIKLEDVRLEWIASNPVSLEGEEAMKVLRLIETLEDLDDTQQVYSNLDITSDLVESFETIAG